MPMARQSHQAINTRLLIIRDHETTHKMVDLPTHKLRLDARLCLLYSGFGDWVFVCVVQVKASRPAVQARQQEWQSRVAEQQVSAASIIMQMVP